MRAQFGILVGSVIVGIPSRSQDHIDLDSRLQTLFPKSKALQFVQAEFLGSAVDDGILEEDPAHSVVVDCRLYGSTA